MRKALLHLKKADPVIGGLIDRIGRYGIEYLEPSYESLARAIVYQQLSGKVAAVIFERLAGATGDGRFTPQAALQLGAARMRALGLSRQKIAYLRELAERALSGELDFAALRRLPDRLVYRRLTAVKGIGAWTVQMFLIFALRRPDVLPSADLGIRAAVQKAYQLPALPTPAQVEDLARPWHPYCTVASWYLWRSLEDKAGM